VSFGGLVLVGCEIHDLCLCLWFSRYLCSSKVWEIACEMRRGCSTQSSANKGNARLRLGILHRWYSSDCLDVIRNRVK